MRIALLTATLLVVTACSRKPDVYIVTSGSVAPAAEATDASGS